MEASSEDVEEGLGGAFGGRFEVRIAAPSSIPALSCQIRLVFCKSGTVLILADVLEVREAGARGLAWGLFKPD